jgi:two-component system phosphate regulon sensor histidine kinase PhoR
VVELLLAVTVVLLVAGYFQIVRPFGELRQALARLANRDFRPVLMRTRLGVFRETARHVRKVSELLQQLDQQIADEGFSLRAILSSMVEGVMITDRSLTIRMVNDPLHRMFGLSQSPVNRTAMEVFRSHDLQEAIQKTMEDGRPRTIELSLPSADGRGERHFEVYSGALQPRPHKIAMGAVVVFHDVTTIRDLEAVRKEFVANVSHEFRTPLAIINGYIETLLDGAIDDHAMAAQSLKVMHRNSQRLTLLLDDLMTLTRLEARSPQLDFQRANLRLILRRVIERLHPAIAERGAAINVDWPEDAEWAVVDAPKIEQVYANLLENAIRYGLAGDVRVGVSARRDGDSLHLVFSDNGPGIPHEDQPHIFERFYRVHKDRSRVAGGTGLGLSIVKHIVLGHGGRVWLVSEPGRGAAFHVVLPLRQPRLQTMDALSDAE